jgi:Dolichyl-phosphate-mannose-protein mannosyltransferase
MDRLHPRSFAAWTLGLWRGVLFPGSTAPCGKPSRVLVFALLLLLPAAILYPGLDFRLLEPDESRYAQIPREMLARGEWVVPTLQGEPYLDKPPLFYWLVMASYRLFGVHDWAARLVPAIAAHATIVLVYLLGRRSLGARPALAGAVLLALAPGFATVARVLILDGLLALLITLAALAAFEAVRGDRLRWGWWLLAAVAAGLGVLTKGPVALVLLVPPLWLHRRLSGRGVSPGWRGGLAFGLVVLAVALPWYVALALRVPGFVRYFFWEHNLQRFLAPGMHVRGVWFYGPVLALMLLPGSLLVLPALRFLFGAGDADKRTPELGYHLLAGCWCVGFFTLSSCKLPTYILPALPFFCLALGHFLVVTGRFERRAVRGVGIASFVVLIAMHSVALPWYAAYRSPMSRPDEVLAICADRETPIVCYPRNCDSIAFYLRRDDLRAYRSKEIEELRTLVRTQPRTVVLCTHRHSLAGLRELLPPEVRIVREVRMGLADIPGVPKGLMKLLARLMGETALGLSDLAVIEAPGWREAARGSGAKLIKHTQIGTVESEDGDDDE